MLERYYKMKVIKYNFVEKFSRYPGARWIKQGPKSGEEFRKKVLDDVFENGDKIEINLDGLIGLTSSFIDGSFGEMAVKYEIDKFKDTITFICNDDPTLYDEIMHYVNKAIEEDAVKKAAHG